MISIDDKLKLLVPVLGRLKIKKLRFAYYFEDDYKAKREIENMIDSLIAMHVKKDIEDEIILPPPKKEDSVGDINIGRVEYLKEELQPFNLKLKDINRHVGIFGSTGSGKTTMARHLIRQFQQKGIPFLVFDWEKSYRNLIHDVPDLQVFTVGTDINPIFLNFLTVPPGIKYDEYIKSIIAIISEDYIGGIGADTMLLNYMETAYEETKHPFFEDLKQIVLREITNDRGKGGKLAGRSGLWKETVSRQITFMSKGAAGTVVNPRKHFPIEKLFSKPIVLEFGGIKSPHDRKFFIHIILNWLSIYNQHCGIFSEQLKQVLIFEEFHNITMRSKEDNMVSSLFRESRKYGVGLIAIDQEPSSIPNSIFTNINTKLSFTLGTSPDIQAMSRAMNLDFEKTKFLGMLKTGQAIVNVKQRHHDSFLIKTPFIPGDENVWDDELRKAMYKFSDHSSVDLPSIELPQIPQTSQNIDKPVPLAPLEKVFMTNIIEKPMEGVDERTKSLGLHPSEILNIHTSLSNKGYIKTTTVDRKKLFDITSKGRKVAKDSGIKIQKQDSKGGIEHNYWINETVGFLKNLDLDAVTEFHGIDIAVPENEIAIEIETGKSDLLKNIIKLLDTRFENVFMIATNKIVELKLKKITKQFPAIQVFFIKDFLKLPLEKITSHTSHSHPKRLLAKN